MKHLTYLLALAGLALATFVVAWFGAGRVVSAVLSAGWSGFGLLALWQGVLFVVLGLAWSAITPGVRVQVLVWGRMVRDAATNCLPFSHLGGLVLGVRAAAMFGIEWPVAAASSVADVTAEFLAQVAFAACALAVLLVHQPDNHLAWPLAGALLFAVALAVAFIWLQHGAGSVFRLFGRHIAGAWTDAASGRMEALQTEFDRIYGRAGRLALGSVIHFLGWIGSGIGTWLAYQALGAPIDLVSALAVEGLVDAVLIFSFLVPGNLGVQEAAFAAIGAVFGMDPDTSLGVSLLRRGRDLAVGVPILLVWQAAEMRLLGRRLVEPGKG